MSRNISENLASSAEFKPVTYRFGRDCFIQLSCEFKLFLLNINFKGLKYIKK